jgi:hypothetical protein
MVVALLMAVGVGSVAFTGRRGGAGARIPALLVFGVNETGATHLG